jgi:hypothetical protein
LVFRLILYKDENKFDIINGQNIWIFVKIMIKNSYKAK